MKVLLVDDEPNTREVYGRLLELAGPRGRDGRERRGRGAEAIETPRFDAALIDVVLGGPDGFAVLST